MTRCSFFPFRSNRKSSRTASCIYTSYVLIFLPFDASIIIFNLQNTLNSMVVTSTLTERRSPETPNSIRHLNNFNSAIALPDNTEAFAFAANPARLCCAYKRASPTHFKDNEALSFPIRSLSYRYCVSLFK